MSLLRKGKSSSFLFAIALSTVALAIAAVTTLHSTLTYAACNTPEGQLYDLVATNAQPETPVYICVDSQETFKAQIIDVPAVAPNQDYDYEFLKGGAVECSGAKTYDTYCECTLSWDEPGEHKVTLKFNDEYTEGNFCGTNIQWIVEVLKIDIEQTITNTCGNAQTNAELNLTTNSYWDGGDVDWTVNTNGLEGIDTSVADVFSFDPSASTQGQYVVTARSSILSNCYDIATVNVYRVELVPPSTNLCWWSTNEFTFTLTNSYWGSAGIEWVGTNDLGVTSVDNDHLRIEPNSSTAKSYTVRAQIEGMTNCGDSADLEVLKIDVDQIDANLCWELTNVTLNLTTDSYDGGGGVTWTSSPSGLSPAFGSGNTLTFNPSNSVPTSYVVTAASSLLPSCTDSCVVDVIKVDIDETNEYKCVSMTNATLNLTDDSYSPDGYAWTWPSSDLSGSASGDIFTYNPSNSTPGTYVVECASSNLTSCSDTCIVNIIRVDVTNIKFTSDHAVLKDNNSDWTDSGTTYGEPEWVNGSTNNPISQTKNTSLTIDLTVKVEPSGLPFDVLGDGPYDYLDFSKTNNTSTGADQQITITAATNLPDQVDTISNSIDWSLTVEGIDCGTATSGPHVVYVTYGTPSGSEVTEKRLSWDCATCDGQTNLTGIADALYTAFESEPPVFSLTNTPRISSSPYWRLMDNSTTNYGQCIDLANLMKESVELLGGTASIGYVYGSTNTDCFSTSSSAYDSRTCTNTNHPGTEVIRVWSANGWNNWEAVCKVDSTCYAIKLDKGSAIEILRNWLGSNTTNGNYQAWRYYDSGWHTCTDPGPCPVPKP